MRTSLVICLVGVLGACASQPASRPAPAQSSSTTATQPTEPAEESLDAKVAKVAATYRKVQKEGQTFYCRTEIQLGSRLPVEHCLTENELTELVRSTEALRDRMRTPRGSPCDQLMGCGA